MLGKAIGPGDDYAESWEIVDHGDDQSVVLNGPLAGKTLGELVREQPAALLGEESGATSFPLLFKFLDCNRTLSVQVHPNDEQGAEARPARPRQDRGVGRPRRGTGKQDLRGAQAGRHPGATRGGDRRGPLRDLPPRVRGPASATASSSRRGRFTPWARGW